MPDLLLMEFLTRLDQAVDDFHALFLCKVFSNLVLLMIDEILEITFEAKLHNHVEVGGCLVDALDLDQKLVVA